jgi:hypothetical protein
MHSVPIERLKELYEYDPEAGRVRFAIDRKCGRGRVRCKAGELAGSVNKGRRLLQADGVRLFEHRVVWALCKGKWPEMEIDHINGDPLDNHIENLRDVSSSVNKQNQRKARSDSSSGFLGAHWNAQAGKWQGRIRFSGKYKHLGFFDDPRDAHAAYVGAKRELHPGCTI